MFNGLSQRCLKLSREVEALIRGDEVGGAQVELVVEPVPQLEQDRLEVCDELRICDLREALLAHAGPCRPTLELVRGSRVLKRSKLSARRPALIALTSTGEGAL